MINKITPVTHILTKKKNSFLFLFLINFLAFFSLQTTHPALFHEMNESWRLLRGIPPSTSNTTSNTTNTTGFKVSSTSASTDTGKGVRNNGDKGVRNSGDRDGTHRIGVKGWSTYNPPNPNPNPNPNTQYENSGTAGEVNSFCVRQSKY